MSLLVLILGAVLVLQLQGLKMYQDVAATDWASFEAAKAVGQMEEEIQACFRVSSPETDAITLVMPKLVWDSSLQTYLPPRPLQTGDQVRYYLSDVTGAPNRNGSFLWRAVKPAGAATFTPAVAPLAEGVHRLTFTYTTAPAPREESVARVTVAVEAEVEEGAIMRTCLHLGNIVLRNAQYGPVSVQLPT